MKSTKLSQVLKTYQREIYTMNSKIESNHFVFGKDDCYELLIANDLESKKYAYRLMYDIYSKPEVGYIKKDPSEMWFTLFNANAKSVTLIVRENNSENVLATLTIVIDSELGLPLEGIYPNEVNELRKQNKKCAEVIALGLVDSIRGSSEILTQLMKYVYLICMGSYDITDILIKVKPNHAFFYEKILSFQQIGKEIVSEKINYKPCVLYKLNFDEAIKEFENDRFEEQFDDTFKRRPSYEIFNSFIKAYNDKALRSKLNEIILNLEMTIEELEYLFIKVRPIFLETPVEKLISLSYTYKNLNTRKFIQEVGKNNSLYCMQA